jgi:hypothetical protein
MTRRIIELLHGRRKKLEVGSWKGEAGAITYNS